MPGNVSKLSVWLRPPEDRQLSQFVAFVHIEAELVKVRCAVSTPSVHRPIAEGREQVGRPVSAVELRKLRNCSETCQIPSVHRSLNIRELELLGVESAANEASHRKPSAAWCVFAMPDTVSSSRTP